MLTGLGAFTVTTPGTPVAITTAAVAAVIGGQATYSPRCQSILFQALSCAAPQKGAHVNTGRVYIYDRNKVRCATLAVPTTNTIPSFTATLPNTIAGLNATHFYIDADNGTDGVDVSILAP